MNKLWLTASISALILVACGKTPPPEASKPAETSASPTTATPVAAAPALDAEKELNIYNWPDYIPKDLLANFTKDTGIKVNYTNFPDNETLQAKLVAGNTGYDIVVPGSAFAKPQIAAGFYQPLDKTLIPNLSNLESSVLTTLANADPNNNHLVPWAWSFTTVGINKSKVVKALGNMPMPDNAWDLVFKPEYTSKLKSCGIAYLDSPTEIIPAMLHYIGKDPYSNSLADYKEAAAKVAAVRKDVRIFSSTMIDDIAGGKACAVISWAGDINIAAARAKENGNQEEIQALIPTKGGLVFFDTMAIMKDAKHPKNAHAFINYFLKPEVGAAMANELGYNSGNKAAIAQIKPDLVANKSIFLDAATLATMVKPNSWSNEGRQGMAEVFTAFKAGK